MRRVFDCFMYRSEIDILTIRLHELNDVVDTFVMVEADKTHSGIPREISFNPNDPRISEFAHKIRHLVLTDTPKPANPFFRDSWQRNAITQGLNDAEEKDLVVISDIDEIPRAGVITEMVNDQTHEVFGVQMALSYFYVNYRNTVSKDANRTWTVAALRDQFEYLTPNGLRRYIMSGLIPAARIFKNGGWHFSFLGDEEWIRKKIVEYAHQEFNTPEFIESIDIDDFVSNGKDLFNRSDYVWEVVSDYDLPKWLVGNEALMNRLFYRKNKEEN